MAAAAVAVVLVLVAACYHSCPCPFYCCQYCLMFLVPPTSLHPRVAGDYLASAPTGARALRSLFQRESLAVPNPKMSPSHPPPPAGLRCCLAGLVIFEVKPARNNPFSPKSQACLTYLQTEQPNPNHHPSKATRPYLKTAEPNQQPHLASRPPRCPSQAQATTCWPEPV